MYTEYLSVLSTLTMYSVQKKFESTKPIDIISGFEEISGDRPYLMEEQAK